MSAGLVFKQKTTCDISYGRVGSEMCIRDHILVVGDTTAALPLAGVIDMAEELKRLQREIEKAEDDLGKMDAKLANSKFVALSPLHI